MGFYIAAKELKSGMRKKLHSSDFVVLESSVKRRGRNQVTVKTYRPFLPQSAEDFQKKHDYGRIKTEADGSKMIYKYWLLAMKETEEELKQLINSGNVKNPTKMDVGSEVEPLINYSASNELQAVRQNSKATKISNRRKTNVSQIIRKEFQKKTESGVMSHQLLFHHDKIDEDPQQKKQVASCSTTAEPSNTEDNDALFDLGFLNDSIMSDSEELSKTLNENPKVLGAEHSKMDCQECPSKDAYITKLEINKEADEQKIKELELNRGANMKRIAELEQSLKELNRELEEANSTDMKKLCSNVEFIVENGIEIIAGLLKAKETVRKTGVSILDASKKCDDNSDDSGSEDDTDNEENKQEPAKTLEGHIYVGLDKYISSIKAGSIMRAKNETLQWKVEQLTCLMLGSTNLHLYWLSSRDAEANQGRVFPQAYIRAIRNIINNFNEEAAAKKNPEGKVEMQSITVKEVREKLKRVLYKMRKPFMPPKDPEAPKVLKRKSGKGEQKSTKKSRGPTGEDQPPKNNQEPDLTPLSQCSDC